jgi:hypothetical protein
MENDNTQKPLNALANKPQLISGGELSTVLFVETA